MSEYVKSARKLFSVLKDQHNATEADLDIIEDAILNIIEREHTIH